MFGNGNFYHGSIRRYVTLFGTYFNEIIISREDNNGDTQKLFRVPISYGPAQKFLSRINTDPTITRPISIALPRMSFEITNVVYDPERRLTGRIRNTKSSSANNQILLLQYTPAPYNIDFTLSIITKYSEDGTKIVEQILPFFKPEWTSSVKLVDDMEEYYDIPTVLTSIANEEVYDGDFNTRQTIIWTLTFTMKGYFFGPVTNKKIIKFANVNFYSTYANNSYSNTSMEKVKIYPGLTSNGEPTTVLSESIDYPEINKDDDYGYIIIIEDV